MNIEICVVDADAATYSKQALCAADAQFPGGVWSFYTVSPPAGSTVVRTNKIPLHHGLPSWTYCFWREVD